jgi:cysteinyl-tRNA synthetase
VYESGRTLPIDALRDPARGSVAVPASSSSGTESEATASTTAQSGHSLSLADDVARAEADFDAALDEGDSARAVRAALDLETSIRNWSADTLQSDAMDRAHAALRSMIVRLGDAAVKGLADPRDAIAPVMSVLIELRGAVRADKRYDLSDLIRDRLAAIGIEVRDTPDGPTWHL